MERMTVDLIYHSPTGDRVTVAKLKGPAVVLAASRQAIEEARLKAKHAGECDPVLGELLDDEATRVQRAVELLVPEA